MSSSFTVYGGGGQEYSSSQEEVTFYTLNINNNELQNCHIKTTSSNLTLNLLNKRPVGDSGFIAISVVSELILSFNHLYGDETSSATKSLNILTNIDGNKKLTLKNNLQTSDVTFLFKYYIVSDNLMIMWNLSDVPEADIDVDAKVPQTLPHNDLYDNIQIFSSTQDSYIPDGVNTFTVYSWGGGGMEDGIITSGSFCQSTITLPIVSDGTKKIHVNVGKKQTNEKAAESSFIVYDKKTLLISGAGSNTDTPGYGLGFVDDDSGTLITQIYNDTSTTVIENTKVNSVVKDSYGRQISFIGSNIQLYKGGIKQNYGTESTLEDIEERFDPYSNSIYKDTKCITQFGTEGITSYHHNAESKINNSEVMYGLGKQNGLVIIRYHNAHSVNGMKDITVVNDTLNVVFESVSNKENSTHWVLFETQHGSVHKVNIYDISQTSVTISVSEQKTFYAYACNEDGTIKFGSLKHVSTGFESPLNVIPSGFSFIEDEIEFKNLIPNTTLTIKDDDENRPTYGQVFNFEVDRANFSIFLNSGIYDIYYFDVSNVKLFKFDSSAPESVYTDTFVLRVRQNTGDIRINEIIANALPSNQGEFAEIEENTKKLINPSIVDFLTDNDIDSSITWSVNGADYVTGESRYLGSNLIEVSANASSEVEFLTIDTPSDVVFDFYKNGINVPVTKQGSLYTLKEPKIKFDGNEIMIDQTMSILSDQHIDNFEKAENIVTSDHNYWNDLYSHFKTIDETRTVSYTLTNGDKIYGYCFDGTDKKNGNSPVNLTGPYYHDMNMNDMGIPYGHFYDVKDPEDSIYSMRVIYEFKNKKMVKEIDILRLNYSKNTSNFDTNITVRYLDDGIFKTTNVNGTKFDTVSGSTTFQISSILTNAILIEITSASTPASKPFSFDRLEIRGIESNYLSGKLVNVDTGHLYEYDVNGNDTNFQLFEKGTYVLKFDSEEYTNRIKVTDIAFQSSTSNIDDVDLTFDGFNNILITPIGSDVNGGWNFMVTDKKSRTIRAVVKNVTSSFYNFTLTEIGEYTIHIIDGNGNINTKDSGINIVYKPRKSLRKPELDITETVLQNSDIGYYFGKTLASYENYLIVGNSGNNNVIETYVNNGTGWQFVSAIEPTVTAPGYGTALKTVGQFLFAGSYGGNDFHGAVFVYNTEFQEIQMLTPPVNNNGSFGEKLDGDGDFLVISEPYANEYAGKVHLYKLNNTDMSIQYMTSFSGSDAYQTFGLQVCLKNGYLFVTSSNYGGYPIQVYKFDNTLNAWQTHQSIPSKGSGYGSSLSSNGTYLFIGGYYDFDGTYIVVTFEIDETTNLWIEKDYISSDSQWDSFGANDRIRLYQSLALISYGGGVKLYTLIDKTWNLLSDIDSSNYEFGKDILLWNDIILIGDVAYYESRIRSYVLKDEVTSDFITANLSVTNADINVGIVSNDQGLAAFSVSGGYGELEFVDIGHTSPKTYDHVHYTINGTQFMSTEGKFNLTTIGDVVISAFAVDKDHNKIGETITRTINIPDTSFYSYWASHKEQIIIEAYSGTSSTYGYIDSNIKSATVKFKLLQNAVNHPNQTGYNIIGNEGGLQISPYKSGSDLKCWLEVFGTGMDITIDSISGVVDKFITITLNDINTTTTAKYSIDVDGTVKSSGTIDKSGRLISMKHILIGRGGYLFQERFASDDLQIHDFSLNVSNDEIINKTNAIVYKETTDAPSDISVNIYGTDILFNQVTIPSIKSFTTAINEQPPKNNLKTFGYSLDRSSSPNGPWVNETSGIGNENIKLKTSSFGFYKINVQSLKNLEVQSFYTNEILSITGSQVDPTAGPVADFNGNTVDDVNLIYEKGNLLATVNILGIRKLELFVEGIDVETIKLTVNDLAYTQGTDDPKGYDNFIWSVDNGNNTEVFNSSVTKEVVIFPSIEYHINAYAVDDNNVKIGKTFSHTIFEIFSKVGDRKDVSIPSYQKPHGFVVLYEFSESLNGPWTRLSETFSQYSSPYTTEFKANEIGFYRFRSQGTDNGPIRASNIVHVAYVPTKEVYGYEISGELTSIDAFDKYWSSSNIDYGYSVASHGIWAAVGAPRYSGGRVYLYKKSNGKWDFNMTLDHNRIGASLFMDDRFLISGSIYHSLDNTSLQYFGRVFIYKYSEGLWNIHQDFGGSNGDGNDDFGHSLHVYGDYLVVGARGAQKVYVYKYDGSNFTEIQMLSEPVTSFGHTVSMDEQFIFIGAPDVKTVYIYRKEETTTPESWTSSQTITVDNHNFGISISRSSYASGENWYDDILIGSAYGTMYVYLYRFNGAYWYERQIIEGEVNSFGRNVSLSKDFAMISSTTETSNQGAVYIYTRDTTGNLIFSSRVTETIPQNNSFFGKAVFVNDDGVMMISSSKDGNKGSAYFVDRELEKAYGISEGSISFDGFETITVGGTVKGLVAFAVSAEFGQLVFTDVGYINPKDYHHVHYTINGTEFMSTQGKYQLQEESFGEITISAYAVDAEHNKIGDTITRVISLPDESVSINETLPRIIQHFGYSIQHSTSIDGPWETIETNVVEGLTKDVIISQTGYYRGNIQGSSGVITKYIDNKISYKPTTIDPTIQKPLSIDISEGSISFDGFETITVGGTVKGLVAFAVSAEFGQLVFTDVGYINPKDYHHVHYTINGTEFMSTQGKYQLQEESFGEITISAYAVDAEHNKIGDTITRVISLPDETVSIYEPLPNVVQHFGYTLETSSTADGPWTYVSGGVVMGETHDVKISDSGFYRVHVQGTKIGSIHTVNLGYEIVYTPFQMISSSSFDASTQVANTSPYTYSDFGTAIATFGDYMFVGAPNEADDPTMSPYGKVYVYQKDQTNPTKWNTVSSINTTAYDSEFGKSVTISGDYLIVGAPNEDYTPDAGVGAVYIYVQDQDDPSHWNQIHRLQHSDMFYGDKFGSSIASIDGTRIFVGAPSKNDGTAFTGAVYVFDQDQYDPSKWNQVSKISTNIHNSEFGKSVTISGDYLIVGAPNEDYTPDAGVGGVYIYVQDQDDPSHWNQIHRLQHSDMFYGDKFGSSIASIDGTRIFVGAPSKNDGTAFTGAVYVFDQDQDNPSKWNQVSKISTNNHNASFGYSLKAKDENIFIGDPSAPAPDPTVSVVGAVYWYKIDEYDSSKWNEFVKIEPTNHYPANFGSSIDIDTHIVIGAPVQWTDPQSSSVFVFDHQTGLNVNNITDSSLIFDGFNKLTIKPFNETEVNAFGYRLEMKNTDDDTEWLKLSEGSELGSSIDYIVTKPGIYRSKVQNLLDGNDMFSSEVTIAYNPSDGLGSAIKQVTSAQIEYNGFREITIQVVPSDTSFGYILEHNTLPGTEGYEGKWTFIESGISTYYRKHITLPKSGFYRAKIQGKDSEVLFVYLEKEITYNPTKNPSYVSNSTYTSLFESKMSYNGYDIINVQPLPNINPTFGYTLERASNEDGPWQVVDRGVSTGTSVDIKIHKRGFYRSKVQGTNGEDSSTPWKYLAYEIIYTPEKQIDTTLTDTIVQDVEFSFDGYDSLSIKPTNVTYSFGYNVEHSENENGPWTSISNKIHVGSTMTSVKITQKGYYRVKVQGTLESRHITSVLPMLIPYTPDEINKDLTACVLYFDETENRVGLSGQMSGTTKLYGPGIDSSTGITMTEGIPDVNQSQAGDYYVITTDESGFVVFTSNIYVNTTTNLSSNGNQLMITTETGLKEVALYKNKILFGYVDPLLVPTTTCYVNEGIYYAIMTRIDDTTFRTNHVSISSWFAGQPYLNHDNYGILTFNEIPSNATEVDLYRNDVLLTNMIIDDTRSSVVQISTPGRYQAIAKKVTETGTYIVAEAYVEVVSFLIDNTVTQIYTSYDGSSDTISVHGIPSDITTIKIYRDGQLWKDETPSGSVLYHKIFLHGSYQVKLMNNEYLIAELPYIEVPKLTLQQTIVKTGTSEYDVNCQIPPSADYATVALVSYTGITESSVQNTDSTATIVLTKSKHESLPYYLKFTRSEDTNEYITPVFSKSLVRNDNVLSVTESVNDIASTKLYYENLLTLDENEIDIGTFTTATVSDIGIYRMEMGKSTSSDIDFTNKIYVEEVKQEKKMFTTLETSSNDIKFPITYSTGVQYVTGIDISCNIIVSDWATSSTFMIAQSKESPHDGTWDAVENWSLIVNSSDRIQFTGGEMSTDGPPGYINIPLGKSTYGNTVNVRVYITQAGGFFAIDGVVTDVFGKMLATQAPSPGNYPFGRVTDKLDFSKIMVGQDNGTISNLSIKYTQDIVHKSIPLTSEYPIESLEYGISSAPGDYYQMWPNLTDPDPFNHYYPYALKWSYGVTSAHEGLRYYFNTGNWSAIAGENVQGDALTPGSLTYSGDSVNVKDEGGYYIASFSDPYIFSGVPNLTFDGSGTLSLEYIPKVDEVFLHHDNKKFRVGLGRYITISDTGRYMVGFKTPSSYILTNSVDVISVDSSFNLSIEFQSPYSMIEVKNKPTPAPGTLTLLHSNLKDFTFTSSNVYIVDGGEYQVVYVDDNISVISNVIQVQDMDPTTVDPTITMASVYYDSTVTPGSLTVHYLPNQHPISIYMETSGNEYQYTGAYITVSPSGTLFTEPIYIAENGTYRVYAHTPVSSHIFSPIVVDSYSPDTPLTKNDITSITSISSSLIMDLSDYFVDSITYTYSFSIGDETVLSGQMLSRSDLSLTAGGSGTTTVTVTAINSKGISTSQSFSPSVQNISTIEIEQSQAYTVPSGISTIKIVTWGAGGSGSTGGYSEGVISVTEGDSLLVVKGTRGGSRNYTSGWAGGYAGGLSGVFDVSGITDFNDVNTLHSNAIVIAGGGGGTNGTGNLGGNGGGSNGGNGGAYNGPHGRQYPAGGGSQTSGGYGGDRYEPTDNGRARQPSGSKLLGGGTGAQGGAGYWGGGAPGDSGAGGSGGGGGSGYIGGNAKYEVTNGQTLRSGSSYGVGTVPNNTHELYKNNFGYSGNAGGVFLILNGT